MAKLILWSQEEFGGRDRKLKELVKRLKQAKDVGEINMKRGIKSGRLKRKFKVC